MECHNNLHELSLPSKRAAMANSTVTLATIGVISVVIGILLQNGKLVKFLSHFDFRTSSHTMLDQQSMVDIRNRSYRMNFEEALTLRLLNMEKFDFDHNTRGIDRRSNLSLDEFIKVYDGKWPVLITDVIPQWKASQWNKDFFLDRYRHERITMKAVDGASDPGAGFSLPLYLFLKNLHQSSETRWTYLQDELFIPMRPDLMDDIGPCVYLDEDFFSLFPKAVRPWNAMLLWGTAHSRSSLHIDPYNWTGTNAVLSGTKKWKLYPPGQDHLLYVVPNQRCGFPLDCCKYNSEVDAFAMNPDQYPLFQRATAVEFEQHAGELLIIPTGWFHQAYNAEVTMAISNQVMNAQNYLVLLEEIIIAGNLKRNKLPNDFMHRSPKQQVDIVMSKLSPEMLKRGELITEDAIRQLNEGMH